MGVGNFVNRRRGEGGLRKGEWAWKKRRPSGGGWAGRYGVFARVERNGVLHAIKTPRANFAFSYHNIITKNLNILNNYLKKIKKYIYFITLHLSFFFF